MLTEIKNCSGASMNIMESEQCINIQYLEDAKQDHIEISFQPDFTVNKKDYILFPACCYQGNQFPSIPKKYPPLFTPQEAKIDMPVTITDVPRLNEDGSGLIEITTGDLSVPCVGIFSREEHRAFFLFSIQEIGGLNLGMSYKESRISITYPALRREKVYCNFSMQEIDVWPNTGKAVNMGVDVRKGEEITIPYKILAFDCEDLTEFFHIFARHRKCMGMDSTRCTTIPFEEQKQIQLQKYNDRNWLEKPGFYATVPYGDPGAVWQPGWIGGGISSYALMKLGGSLEWERGIRTLQFVFQTQAKSGFLYGFADADGNPYGEIFGNSYSDTWTLVRKSGDMLYFLWKHFVLFQKKNLPIPEEFLDGTRKLADAFIRLWKKYHQFGQFVDLETGDLIVGGSASGGIVPAGLIGAYRLFKEPKYLNVALESAEEYYTQFAQKGYTTGAPEEILQSPDSESAFALMESFVVLYEETHDKKWLDRAVYMADFCSSWVVSYNYRFPEDSEFGRLKMKTTGAVFANVQNKHAAPGICTLSGDSLYKVYQWTKDPLYLEMFLDVTMTISQYMSTDEQPVYAWEIPQGRDPAEERTFRVPENRLPQGYINERVNMSDWEMEREVGGVFYGSCWSEVSNLLVLAECIDFPEKNGYNVERKC